MDRIRFEDNQTLLFIGDSITDAGRRQPDLAPLGRGYVFFAANLLRAERPELALRVLNRGVGGDTTRTLLPRWRRDCLDENPDVVSLMIGINDVWCQHSDSEWADQAVLPEEFASNYRQLLTSLRRHRPDCRLILCEPFMFCRDREDPMRAALETYVEQVQGFAREFDALLAPFQPRIDELLDAHPTARCSEDGVHPYDWAHAWLARIWLACVVQEFTQL